jgi:hypothetical protein
MMTPPDVEKLLNCQYDKRLARFFLWNQVPSLFYYEIHHNYCTRCANFSCPLNRVPKDIVDAYLTQSPVMRQAWEQSGYRLE